ncbi:Fur family transcriptional regulator [Sphingomonas bacterium]|uniref:Fur family transcriptional regulator n=1 Tax=Sphingomonas bacterium TaxID=1895847 RepID=UPI0015753B4A|nr:transcriptional repressor [Sphingomonas bacterium]
MAHRHQHHEGASLASAAKAALIKAGEQWTPMRETVFGALSEQQRPASAYDIADLISKREDRRVPANSIYRILDLFVATNLARRVESANAYIVNAHPACQHDCMFLICDGCGTVTHVDDDKLAGLLRDAAGAKGFKPERPVVEMHGRCADCA